MFGDSWCLDLSKMTWEEEGRQGTPPAPGFKLCNSLCDDIESLPHHKVGAATGLLNRHVAALGALICVQGKR
jgi:hypothetical protein